MKTVRKTAVLRYLLCFALMLSLLLSTNGISAEAAVRNAANDLVGGVASVLNPVGRTAAEVINETAQELNIEL